MPCLAVAIAFFFPRLVLALLALFTTYIGSAYQTVLWPVLGFFLLPYTTLAYAWAWHAGNGSVRGPGLIVVILAALIDLGAHGSSTRATRRVYVKRRRRSYASRLISWRSPQPGHFAPRARAPCRW